MKKSLLAIAVLLFLTMQAAVAQDSCLPRASLGDHGNEGTYGCTIGNRIYVLRGSIPDFLASFRPMKFGNTIQ